MNLLVTNHAQVLACIARNPSARLRDVAESVGLTERAVQRLVADLETGGFLRRIREGRRNRYQVAAEPLQMLARSLQALVPEGLGDSKSCAHSPERDDAEVPVAPPAPASTGPGSLEPFAPQMPLAGSDGIARNQSFID